MTLTYFEPSLCGELNEDLCRPYIFRIQPSLFLCPEMSNDRTLHVHLVATTCSSNPHGHGASFDIQQCIRLEVESHLDLHQCP